MKSKLFFLFLLLSNTSVIEVFAQGYRISTNIENQKDTLAYLGHHFATQRYVDDTARVENGKASFAGSENLTEGIYFYYSPSVYFEFLIGEQNFTIAGDASNVVATAKIKGSPLNIAFYNMQKFTNSKRSEANKLKAELDSASSKEQKAKIEELLREINQEIKNYQKDLQKKFPNTILDRLIHVMQTPVVPDPPIGADTISFRYNYYKAHFWDGIDIADPGLLRSPLLDNKIKDYLDNVVLQQPDTVILAVDKLIALSKKNEESYRYLLITLTNKYEQSPVMGFDKVFVHLVDTYYQTDQVPWADAETLKKLEERAASIRPNFIGNPAPKFSLQDTLGTDYNLYDIKARYTVLYFYDPDCGHCKKATPILHDAYPELKAKGVEILGICTTTDGQRWREFIVENDLDWINLADLSSTSYFKYYYDIRSTPTVYILGKDKKILIKKIASEDIPEIIDQLISVEDR